MSLREVGRVVRRLLSWSRAEEEMREELALHLEQRADDLAASGLTREDALRRARLEFGAIESFKEQCRDARGFLPLRAAHGLWVDLRLAARRLRAAPLFLTFAVVSLALGVAVTTTVYSLLRSTLWKPIGIRDAARVVLVTSGGGYGEWRGAVSLPDAEDLQASVRSASGIALSAPVAATLATDTASETVEVEAVSASYFTTLGAAPALGRAVDRADDQGMAAVAVLSDRIWRTRFNAERQVVGRLVRIGGQRFQVVGVAPDWFEGLAPGRPVGTAVWIPLRSKNLLSGADASRDGVRTRPQVSVAGRLAASASMPSASAEIATIASRLDAAYPLPDRKAADGHPVAVRRQWSSRAVNDTGNSRANMVGGLALVVVGLVLIVACTNLANLTLARGAVRQHEIAVRRALGASRWRLVRGLVAESLLVAIAGVAVAVAFIRVLLSLLTVEVSTMRGALQLRPVLSVSALGVALAAVLLSLFVFGVEPALQLTRAPVNAGLAQGSTSVVPRTRRHRALLRWQVAVSVCLFLLTAVFVRVIVSEARHDSGVDVDRLAIATVFFPEKVWSEARARQTLENALRFARETPGIDCVALSSGLPFGFNPTPYGELEPEDDSGKGVRDDGAVIPASPEVFRTLGVPIVDGRGFDDRDGPGTRLVAVVSEHTARALFGRQTAIGRGLRVVVWQRPPAWNLTIIGTARDTDTDRYMTRGGNVIYVPFAQHYQPFTALVARTSLTPSAAAMLLQAAVRRADADLGTGTASAAWPLLGGAYVAAVPIGASAAGLGMLTLALAMVGLFGVMSEAVTRRTQEFGIRISLGAGPRQVKAMVLRQGLRPIAEGAVIGIALGVAARAVVRSIVVAPIDLFDLPALVAVPALLFAAALVACYVPARHASRVDPNVALRAL